MTNIYRYHLKYHPSAEEEQKEKAQVDCREPQRGHMKEYVIHDGITILLVVEASSANQASVKARRNTTLPQKFSVTLLNDFYIINDADRKALRTARRHWYEIKVKTIQERIRQAEESLKPAQDTLKKLEKEAYLEEAKE
jgi:hypothetical protein